MAGGQFPGIRALVDVIGQLEDLDFNLMFRLLREGVTVEQLRKFYWEREDYLFMAPVHTVIDIARFTFTWRGRVLIARAFPDTSTLQSQDLVLIRKLPASKEYFTIIRSVSLYMAVRVSGSLVDRIVYADALSTLTSWHFITNPPPQSGGADWLFQVDASTKDAGYVIQGNATFVPRLYRNMALKTGVWELILDDTDIDTLTSLSPGPNDSYGISALHTVAGEKGLIAVLVSVTFNNNVNRSAFLFHSHNYGDTWTAVQIGTINANVQQHEAAVVIAHADHNVIYANIRGFSGEFINRIYKSSDKGHSIVRVDNGSSDTINASLFSGKQSDATTLFLWSNTWARSIDSGVSWATIGTPTSILSRTHIATPTATKIAAIRVGGVGNVNRRVGVSLDSGVNWTFAFPDTAAGTDHVFVLEDGLYVVAGRGRVTPFVAGRVFLVTDTLVQTTITGDLVTVLGGDMNSVFGMGSFGVPYF